VQIFIYVHFLMSFFSLVRCRSKYNKQAMYLSCCRGLRADKKTEFLELYKNLRREDLHSFSNTPTPGASLATCNPPGSVLKALPLNNNRIHTGTHTHTHTVTHPHKIWLQKICAHPHSFITVCVATRHTGHLYFRACQLRYP
jgi:hypothetical protein